MKYAFAFKIGFLLCLTGVDGCGGTLGGNPEINQETAGNPDPAVDPGIDPGTGPIDVPTGGPALSFALTDAPIADARSVFITIDSVSVLAEGDNWIEIPLQAATEIDLLQYQGGLSTPLAAISDLAPGVYTETRLILSETAPSRLVDLDGEEHILKVPSGSESGLKIKQPITIEAGKSAAFTIDFDLRKSVKINGNGNGNGGKYMMKPVLRLVENVKSGSISGTGPVGTVVCLYEQNTVKDSDDSCDNAVSSTTLTKAQFEQKFIEAGTYDLRIFRNGAIVKDMTGIVVASKKNTGVLTLP